MSVFRLRVPVLTVLRTMMLGLTAALLAISLPGGAGQRARADDAADLRFVALGDAPYRLPDDYRRFEVLIDRINAVQPAFSVHVGDIKSGSSPCSDDAFAIIRDYFGRFRQPLVYTPGDNEWTDCHRDRAGGYDPLERLARLRQVFFADPTRSLGAASMPVETQAAGDAWPEMVENARWTSGTVTFATVHVVGSNNGMERSVEAMAEYMRRDAANADWIGSTFARAAADNARAVVILFHANPMFEVENPWDYTNAGFKRTLAELARGAADFARPVLLVHGDFHTFLADRPLRDAQRKLLRNVWRLEVPGSPDVGAVQVTVRPADARAPFSFAPMLVD